MEGQEPTETLRVFGLSLRAGGWAYAQRQVSNSMYTDRLKLHDVEAEWLKRPTSSPVTERQDWKTIKLSKTERRAIKKSVNQSVSWSRRKEMTKDERIVAKALKRGRTKAATERAISSKKTTRKFVPAKLREQVFKRDGLRCQYCDTIEGPFHLDHFVPLCQGGPTVLNNLVVACIPCNLKKGTNRWQLGQVGQIDYRTYNSFRREYGLPRI